MSNDSYHVPRETHLPDEYEHSSLTIETKEAHLAIQYIEVVLHTDEGREVVRDGVV
jgi:hypothetical protein